MTPAFSDQKVHLHDLEGHMADRGVGNEGIFGKIPVVSYPPLLLEEVDPEFFVQLSRSKDWEWLIVNINSKSSSEVGEPVLA